MSKTVQVNLVSIHLPSTRAFFCPVCGRPALSPDSDRDPCDHVVFTATSAGTLEVFGAGDTTDLEARISACVEENETPEQAGECVLRVLPDTCAVFVLNEPPQGSFEGFWYAVGIDFAGL